MHTATFTFAKRRCDEDFHALDEVIASVARSIPGYLGEESRENAETGLVSNVDDWASMEALRQLMSHPSHAQAKQSQSRWLNGYQVVIAQVIATYGDGGIVHPLAGRTPAAPARPRRASTLPCRPMVPSRPHRKTR